MSTFSSQIAITSILCLDVCVCGCVAVRGNCCSSHIHIIIVSAFSFSSTYFISCCLLLHRTSLELLTGEYIRCQDFLQNNLWLVLLLTVCSVKFCNQTRTHDDTRTVTIFLFVWWYFGNGGVQWVHSTHPRLAYKTTKFHVILHSLWNRSWNEMSLEAFIFIHRNVERRSYFCRWDVERSTFFFGRAEHTFTEMDRCTLASRNC